jgi:hypothetical protein
MPQEQLDETFLETDRGFLSAFANCNLSKKIVDKLVVMFRISAIYIGWICLHYVSSYLYVTPLRIEHANGSVTFR